MDAQKPGTIERRTWLVGATAASLAMACGVEAGGSAPANAVPAEAVGLFGELAPGSNVEQWTIVAVHPVRHGALPVVLASVDGSRYQVDVMARDDHGPAGIATTPSLSLFVANRGDGGTPTDEDQGLGAMALARALSQREAAGAEVPALSTFGERASQHPDGAFAVPLG